MSDYHLVGIGGAGMSSLATYLRQSGASVSGSDAREAPILGSLRDMGMEVSVPQCAERVEQARCVVYSSAIPADNVELRAAAERGIARASRGEILAQVVRAHPGGVAVCGTHGKGTTAGALIAILEAAGESVSAVLGAHLRDGRASAWFKEDARWLVAEVDESDKTHLYHRPRHLLITNLDADHLNVYGSIEAIVESFVSLCTQFIDQPSPGALLLGWDGEGMPALRAALETRGVPFEIVGGDPASSYQVEALTPRSDGTYSFSLRTPDGAALALESALRGELNTRNLAAAAALALALGLPPEAVRRGVSTYQGLVDRFQEVEVAGRRLVTDYTSHPTSILGNLRALKARTKGAVHAVFQPFRYSLLSHHFEAYIQAFAEADALSLAPLDPGGEAPIHGVGVEELAQGIEGRGTPVICFSGVEEIEASLGRTLKAGETCIVFGGGPLFGMARALELEFQKEERG